MSLKVKHSMPAGDLLAQLPGLRQVSMDNDISIYLYQRVNLPYGDMMGAYVGAAYSIKDESNVPVTMNRPLFDALYPLLIYQDYIADFIEWDGHETNIDLDVLRMQDTTMPYGSLNRHAMYVFPDMATDLSKKWLTIPKKMDHRAVGKILINRTARYNNMLVSYNFLRKYKDSVLFVGLFEEHKSFCEQNKIDIPRLDLRDYLEIAIALQSCKLYIGGQSSIFQVSEGLKVPRLLEVCKQIPNVIGCGPGFYDFLNQYCLEYYVDKLFNK